VPPPRETRARVPEVSNPERKWRPMEIAISPWREIERMSPGGSPSDRDSLLSARDVKSSSGRPSQAAA